MIVVVTGGTRGIGLATVERLAGSGHRVFAAARRALSTPLPDGVSPLEMDVSSEESARTAIDRVVSRAGGIDVLVNNAGVGSLGPLEEVSDEEAHGVFEVNLFGPLRLARLVVPLMRRQGGGRIINVSSMNDVMPAPFGSWYSASKAALSSASSVLAAEVRQFGIFVTVVAPGLFLTDMAHELGTIQVDPGSAYGAALRAVRVENVDRLKTAGDPDLVAGAIEDCIDSDDPPARVVVGADARGFEQLVRQASPDDFARMLQDYVDQLTERGSSG